MPLARLSTALLSEDSSSCDLVSSICDWMRSKSVGSRSIRAFRSAAKYGLPMSAYATSASQGRPRKTSSQLRASAGGLRNGTSTKAAAAMIHPAITNLFAHSHDVQLGSRSATVVESNGVRGALPSATLAEFVRHRTPASASPRYEIEHDFPRAEAQEDPPRHHGKKHNQ